MAFSFHTNYNKFAFVSNSYRVKVRKSVVPKIKNLEERRWTKQLSSSFWNIFKYKSMREKSKGKETSGAFMRVIV